MTFRETLLSMTAAAALATMPVLAMAQQGGSSGGGSSMQSTTTQTTPQQGPVSSTPAARAGAEPSGTGPTQAPANRTAQGTTGTRDASGGVMAQGTTSGTTTSPRDGTPGNPPSTAVQRGADSVTGNRTPPDGTPGNPPGTAAGRAMDRTLGTNTTGANPSGTSATTGRTTGTTTTGTTTAGASSGAMAIDSAALRNGRRASKIIGSNIYNENNESIGEVEDILIPAPASASGGTAPAPVAIISVGGFLGIGAKLVAVPYDRLQMNTERNRWTLSGATKDSLTALPTFTYEGTAADRRG